MRALHKHTKGVPRLINVLAHKSLLAAYGEGKVQVSHKHVIRAAIDTPAAIQDAGLPFGGLAMLSAMIIGVVALLFIA